MGSLARRHPTWTMLPSARLHEVVELRGAVARMLWAADIDGLRARLAPRVAASREGADNVPRFLVLRFVDEDGLSASGGGVGQRQE